MHMHCGGRCTYILSISDCIASMVMWHVSSLASWVYAYIHAYICVYMNLYVQWGSCTYQHAHCLSSHCRTQTCMSTDLSLTFPPCKDQRLKSNYEHWSRPWMQPGNNGTQKRCIAQGHKHCTNTLNQQSNDKPARWSLSNGITVEADPNPKAPKLQRKLKITNHNSIWELPFCSQGVGSATRS